MSINCSAVSGLEKVCVDLQVLLLVKKEVSPCLVAAGMSFGVKVSGKVIRHLCPLGRDISHYLWWALRNEAEQLIACHRLFI